MIQAHIHGGNPGIRAGPAAAPTMKTRRSAGLSTKIASVGVGQGQPAL